MQSQQGVQVRAPLDAVVECQAQRPATVSTPAKNKSAHSAPVAGEGNAWPAKSYAQRKLRAETRVVQKRRKSEDLAT